MFQRLNSFQILSANDGSRHGPYRTIPSLAKPMAATLRSLKRPLRTNFQCTRYFSSNADLPGLGPSPHLNGLYRQLDFPRCAHRAALWRKSTQSCRSLSTHTPPPPKSPRARVVSARELYAQRNRSLFMYTSAVVSPRFASRCAVVHILNRQYADNLCCRRILRCRTAVPYVLCGNRVRWNTRCRHWAIRGRAPRTHRRGKAHQSALQRRPERATSLEVYASTEIRDGASGRDESRILQGEK